ncbi:MAG: nucleoside kinase [Candidatus Cloacimonadales bacterium]|jgi:uridine kinase|nr:nucleoside kinase [Candidatus Cloacimonadota bacterium]MDY0381230.1 nucleoside kinase [Candidatus Cloacimonadaceae bacterium]MCB5264087.1 nucleoside kinase [Candidatus Cloacimonadota bacterium]MCB5276529.1 nucleoside kinase [Candidatus Cloacimonadota bacterium]MDD2615660.1 nucleoside kinase [Candidatus Cloacimonadota bacterium]
MKIDIRKDGHKHSLIELEKARPISQIIKGSGIDRNQVLSYKINHTEYVNEDYLPDGDTLVNCITIRHPEGYRIYQDTAIFILAKALHTLLGGTHSLVAEHSIADGVFCEVFNAEKFSMEDVQRLKAEMQRIIESDLPIDRIEVSRSEAIDIFNSMHRKDVLKNIKYHYAETVSIYKCGKYYDFFIRPLADRTSFITQFDIQYQEPGFILRFPSGEQMKLQEDFVLPKKVFALHQEHDKWLDILRVHNISDINRLNDNYEISQFILVEEALHEKKIAEIAANIVQNKDVKLILIAGPSSSGKTTFAKRLSVQFQASKAKPIIIGLDDYFLNRDRTPRKENGDYDFESIHSIDLEYLNLQLTQLLAGEQIELPHYDFTRGIRRRSNNFVKMEKDNIVIMEGIHGLNNDLTSSIPEHRKARIYISALNQLNIDNHNRIPTTDCRLLRRIIRDHQYRGYSAEETIRRWPDVREGEEKNIFPFQENADYMFNSSLTYELGVLKKHAWKELLNVPSTSSAYTESRRLLRLLSHSKDIDDAQVPHNSIIREFTNGSVFRY